MDILGYQSFTKQAHDKREEDGALKSIHSALSAAREWIDITETKPPLSKFVKKDWYALKAFTDNIVIGWPVSDDAESELVGILDRLTSFQLAMAMRGFFVRGGIAIGDCYIDDIAVFGQGLLDAYDAESKLARDPRIILTPLTVEAAKQHLTYYYNQRGAPHAHYILKDADGQWFVNYLHAVLMAEDEQGPFEEELLLHKSQIEDRLERHKTDPPVWSKYAWVAGYHNYFCGLHPRHFDSGHKIDVELFRASPSLIVDEPSPNAERVMLKLKPLKP